MDNVFAFAEEFSMRTEASYSSIRYVGFLQDFELHRSARSGLCHGTDVFTDTVPALPSSVTQLPMSIAIEQVGPRFALACLVCCPLHAA